MISFWAVSVCGVFSFLQSFGEFFATVFYDVPDSLVAYTGYVFEGGLWGSGDDHRGLLEDVGGCWRW